MPPPPTTTMTTTALDATVWSLGWHIANNNRAIVDSRLCAWCTTHDEYWVFIILQNLVVINALGLAVMLLSHHLGVHTMHHRVFMWIYSWCQPRKWKYMMYHSAITEGRNHGQSTCLKSLVKFGQVVSEIIEMYFIFHVLTHTPGR